MSLDVEKAIEELRLNGYEELRTRKRLEAANRLEELTAIAKQVVIDLRGQDGAAKQQAASDMAYARVYWLRRELGHVVATLGVGLPDGWRLRLVAQEYKRE